MLIFLLVVPVLLGTITLCMPGEEKRRIRRRFLMAGATLHFFGTGALYLPGVSKRVNDYLVLDDLGLLFLSITSLLFFFVSIYSFGYFFREEQGTALPAKGVKHLYTPCMLFFLSVMTLTCTTQHLGLLWVGIEATTLATAPLIYYHHHEQALEATWKYLLICSVGIALALLGILFIAASGKGGGSRLFVPEFVAMAGKLDPRWLKLGFILVLVGFGAKMGLAPMHSWLPDAHSEAPSPVSALLSGALLNAAFLGILRTYQILAAASLAPFAGKLLTVLGIVSLGVAAIFITAQKDFKRMLAYSSVEHMGILALGIGVGAGFGSLLHVINHSLTKALLFLLAGQIVLAYRTKKTSEVTGLFRTLPATSILFAAGGLAILGSPPFAPFLSEFLILRDGFQNGHPWAMSLYIIFLGIIFVSMSKILFGMLEGEKREIEKIGRYRLMMVSPVLFAGAVFLFGFYLPPPLTHFLKNTALSLGGFR
ncbi:MAG: proton-conducting transporter membrane subunit [Deltaproteobacteria bacterium]|nr:proton-conducting transporter membrane subunit [Deltaproteobacteria bacterium]